MKKFKGMLFCTDLDGTLLRNDQTISEENLRAIRYFKQEGGLFTFVTGRMPFFVKNIYDRIDPNAPFGCINGGGIYDHRAQSYVWTRALSLSALELVEAADRVFPQIGIQINAFDHVWFCRENEAMAAFRRATGMPNLVCDYHGFGEPIGKIVFGDESEETLRRLEMLLRSHPMAAEFDFIRSERTLFEILPLGNSKGSLLLKMAQLLGVDPGRTVAIGDYYNDVSMIRAAGIGVAVSNACEDAKAAADLVTVSNEEHAIAKVVELLDSDFWRV